MLPGLILFLLLAGCKTDEEMPFYRFEEGETPVLIVDGIRYIEDTDIIRQQTSAMGLFWKFSGEIGNTIICNDAENTSLRVDDSAAIASLLDVFNGDDIQVPNGEDWLNGVLVMQNREFPFLQCEIQFCYSPRQGISYCQNTEREWFLLPEQWSAIISELDFSV